ncbi:uncharacterized protein N0V89_003149 [Didymosphaeria variabile]|uniref:Uncharacterized protein n=1 Tax=Didymosphaeria variabile TaxID=1932322 RepID=A0A9W9CF35_9PLEO|nr:uncharacterized protein N0V89_003149 [Didymosphaeria variabile]KAJ4358565.1 hypothetical protein N0V89_003149 [Didymosphaeria variabile]
MAPTASATAGAIDETPEESMPMDESAGPASPRLRRDSISYSQATTDAKPAPSLPSPENSPPEAQYTSHSFEFNPQIPATARAVDLDGMSMMPIALPTSSASDSALDLSLGLDDITNGPTHQGSAFDWGMEAGLLFKGIKDGWTTFDDWKQSPVLQILKAVDQFLFVKSGKMERLAASYKSFKLLKYYLNPTKEELDRVPTWLRPSALQSSTHHPIAIDMFAWPSLRNRLVHHHHTLFRNSKLSNAYANHLRFDWPFSFEDTFYYDEGIGGWYPSPLFERYHGDVRCWTVGEAFWEGLEELRGDIEGCVA